MSPSVAENNPLITAQGAGRLVSSIAFTLLIIAGLMAGMIVLANKPAWWPGLAAAALISLIASACSLYPLVRGLRKSLNGAVVGYFLAMAIRAGLSVGGGLVAVHVGGYPKAATLLLMTVFYFGVLIVETAAVARALRALDIQVPRN
jgi:hypothetical protein